jgi:flagella basal body P-ring formation protein FlgA
MKNSLWMAGWWLGSCLWGSYDLAAAEYKLKTAAVAHGPYVLGRDILDPVPEGKMALVKLKLLGRPGTVLQLSRDLVFAKLKKSAGDDGLVLNGTFCTVTASHRKVDGADIVAFAENFIRDGLKSLTATAKIEIKKPDRCADLVVPDRIVRFEVAGRSRDRLRGNVILQVQLKQDDPEGEEDLVGSVPLSFMVKVSQPMMVAVKTLRKGDILGSENVLLKMTDITFLQGDGFENEKDILGLRATRLISADKVVLNEFVERAPIIKKGDIIKLIVRANGVAVNAPAKAMRDGAKGDRIPVEIEGNKKQVQGTVVDERTVFADVN